MVIESPAFDKPTQSVLRGAAFAQSFALPSSRGAIADKKIS